MVRYAYVHTMPVRVTMSLSQELTDALDRIASDRDDSRSAVAEMLLREAPQVRGALRALRGDSSDPPNDHPPMETVGSHTRRVYG